MVPPADLKSRASIDVFSDLPGVTAEVVANWLSGACAVRVLQEFGPSSPEGHRTLAGVFGEFPTTVLDDLSVEQLAAAVEAMLSHRFRPWLYPDESPFPQLVLFPRIARAAGWWRRLVRR